ncbi:MAG: DUF981 domain-containing protein, partial [Thermoplasmata archaeon]|nr:DUF981 domain-containing protein [Thermoplasmata archaeon]
MAGAVILSYTAIRVFMGLLRNEPGQVRAALKSSAIPAGMVGGIGLLIGLWTEFTWPYLLADSLGSYDIFFGDVITLFGMVMIVYAIVEISIPFPMIAT